MAPMTCRRCRLASSGADAVAVAEPLYWLVGEPVMLSKASVDVDCRREGVAGTHRPQPFDEATSMITGIEHPAIGALIAVGRCCRTPI